MQRGQVVPAGIYNVVKPQPLDKLFLPATLGIINASSKYDSRTSEIVVVRRAESRIETISEGDASELSALAQRLLGAKQTSSGRMLFVVSNQLIQMLTHDPRLKLVASGYSFEPSKRDLSDAETEALFQRFLSTINNVAERQTRPAPGR